jgi:negative regulator of sigma E activity
VKWVATAFLAALLAAPGQERTPEVLARAVAARGQAAYAGEQLVAVWDGDRAYTALVHVQHDPAGTTRLVYRGPGSGTRRVVWHVGDRTVEYDPHTRRGRAYRSYEPPVPSQAQLAWLARNYSLTSTPVQVLGRPAVHVRVTPKRPGRPRADLRVDSRTGVVLRSERVSPDGKHRELSAFLSFVPRPVGWMRWFRVPQNLQLEQEPLLQRAREEEVVSRLGRPLPAVWLPSDFLPLTDFLLDPRTGVARRLYSDGLTTLVLSFRRAAGPLPPVGSRVVFRGGGPVWVRSLGLQNTLHWAYGGWAFTLVGDLSVEALLEVADRTGVQPAPSVLDNLLRWLGQTVGWTDL